jgi:hypothetical protein
VVLQHQSVVRAGTLKLSASHQHGGASLTQSPDVETGCNTSLLRAYVHEWVRVQYGTQLLQTPTDLDLSYLYRTTTYPAPHPAPRGGSGGPLASLQHGPMATTVGWISVQLMTLTRAPIRHIRESNCQLHHAFNIVSLGSSD